MDMLNLLGLGVAFLLVPCLAYAGIDDDMIYTARFCDVERVKELLTEGANIKAKNKDGQTALMEAVSCENAELAKFLLEKGAEVNAKNNKGYTALIWAADGHMDAVKLLLEKNADINAKVDISGTTALIYAANFGHADIVKFLIEKGADVNAKMNHGETALSKAEQMGHTDVVAILKGAKKSWWKK